MPSLVSCSIYDLLLLMKAAHLPDKEWSLESFSGQNIHQWPCKWDLKFWLWFCDGSCSIQFTSPVVSQLSVLSQLDASGQREAGSSRGWFVLGQVPCHEVSLHAQVAKWKEKQPVFSHEAESGSQKEDLHPWIFKWGHVKNKDRQTRDSREIKYQNMTLFFFFNDCTNQVKSAGAWFTPGLLPFSHRKCLFLPVCIACVFTAANNRARFPLDTFLFFSSNSSPSWS